MLFCLSRIHFPYFFAARTKFYCIFALVFGNMYDITPKIYHMHFGINII